MAASEIETVHLEVIERYRASRLSKVPVPTEEVKNPNAVLEIASLKKKSLEISFRQNTAIRSQMDIAMVHTESNSTGRMETRRIIQPFLAPSKTVVKAMDILRPSTWDMR